MRLARCAWPWLPWLYWIAGIDALGSFNPSLGEADEGGTWPLPAAPGDLGPQRDGMPSALGEQRRRRHQASDASDALKRFLKAARRQLLGDVVVFAVIVPALECDWNETEVPHTNSYIAEAINASEEFLEESTLTDNLSNRKEDIASEMLNGSSLVS
ncbi:unnamed protein product [Symbiodinium sp. KB8]|nr:unnamed protein product [Symbiodinium sp. KB8]